MDMNWLKSTLLAAILAVYISGTALAGGMDAVLSETDMLKLPEWSVTATSYGGKLLLSDSPEIVPDDGIMYQDTVNGDVRLFFHHVNGTQLDKKIVVVLENNSSELVQVTVYKYGVAGPEYDYLAVGKEVQATYLSNNDIYIVEVPPHGVALLDEKLGDTRVRPNMLVNGIYDFKTDRPVTVKTMMLPIGASIKQSAAQAKILPPDEQHLRGTFDGPNHMLIPYKIYNPDEDGMSVITLADNRIDRYVQGIDATDGSNVVNYGNYGVVYKLFLPSEYSGKLGYYLNPRGGEYAGVLGVKYRHILEKDVAIPSDRLSFGSNKLTDFAHIGDYEGGKSVWLTFSPPGASNLPVKLVIVPLNK